MNDMFVERHEYINGLRKYTLYYIRIYIYVYHKILYIPSEILEHHT